MGDNYISMSNNENLSGMNKNCDNWSLTRNINKMFCTLNMLRDLDDDDDDYDYETQ